jgi:hypothetical protein
MCFQWEDFADWNSEKRIMMKVFYQAKFLDTLLAIAEMGLEACDHAAS